MGQATPISGCVISFQEADRIEDCVRSLRFCDEVIVVDSGSSDGTVERAAALGARVLVNAPFPGHIAQKQRCVDAARHDWVLCLDADERVTDELRAEIQRLRATGLSGAACEMPRRNHYLGRPCRGGIFVPDRKIRLFDRRRARWGGLDPHDRVEVEPGGEVIRLDAPIEHLSYRDFAQHRRTIDSFTRIAAQSMHRAGRRGSLADLLFRPPAVFVKSLLLKRGFLDGWRGVLIATMSGYYVGLKYARLRALQRVSG